jgi:hypothetical protein
MGMLRGDLVALAAHRATDLLGEEQAIGERRLRLADRRDDPVDPGSELVLRHVEAELRSALARLLHYGYPAGGQNYLPEPSGTPSIQRG